MNPLRKKNQSRTDNVEENVIFFFWNNKKYFANKGDSIAAGLLANNQHVIGRSFKYHRPRGIMSAGVEEAGALVTIGNGAYTEANVRATTTELTQGLSVYSQNAWPSVKFDIGSMLNVLGRFFAAGFYYKMFMGIPPFEWGRGTKIWMFFEHFIRKAAGLGQSSRLPDPDCYEHMHTHTDVLVIGTGPAGLQAAISAAEEGKDVLIVEQDYAIGGSYLSQPDTVELETQIEVLKKLRVTILTRTTAFGLYDDKTVGLVQVMPATEYKTSTKKPRQQFNICRAEKIILATGAIERSYAFINNDLPGIMSVSAARTYLNRYNLLLSKNIVISTNNDSAYETAIELENAGATITILDAREQIGNKLLQQIAGLRINLYLGSGVVKAEKGLNTSSIGKIKLVEFANNKWRYAGNLSCDCLLISAGWSPVIHLASHQGYPINWNEENACFLSSGDNKSIFLIGSARGIWTKAGCIQSAKEIFQYN